jgi:hypothetical protein
MSNFNVRHGDCRGGKRHPLYVAYRNMVARCGKLNHPQFHYYGGRGIAVCEEWSEYLNFKRWSLEHGWRKGLSLDRTDNNGGYSPSNCRWVNHREQMSNTSRNRFLEYGGERKTIAEWSRSTGFGWKTIETRLKGGWSVKDTLTMPTLSRVQCGKMAHEKRKAV